jgi:hypothetical protein
MDFELRIMIFEFPLISLKNKWSDLDHQLFRNIRGYFKTQLNKKPVVLLHIIKGE